MSEEDIIYILKQRIERKTVSSDPYYITQKAIEGILDLYNKEKEKNKWKPISEYNREKYDWVLVKYFDGEYECVPEVAEQRCDGKWYTSEKEIPFEVKYFFDMQLLQEGDTKKMKKKLNKKLTEEQKEKAYKIIKQINNATDYLCAKQFYNYIRR